LIILTLLVATGPVRAEEPDEVYLGIYKIIEQADSLRESGQTNSARAKYQEAQVALRNFKKSYPTWNVKMVSYRLNYLAEKSATATDKPEAKSGDQAAAPSAKQVKLLDAGGEPRKVLRLHAKAGDKQTLGMALRIAMDMGTGAPMKMPGIKMTMDVSIKSVSADGDISYEMVVGEASVEEDPGAMPQVVEQMKASLGNVKGLSSTGTMSNRGLSKGSEAKLPPGADPQARQAIEQMKESLSHCSVPLPEEAVGPGARWEVKLPLKSQGMTINQTATYQLLSIEGDRLNAKSTIVQNAANQKIQNPAMPGLKLDVSKMTGNGAGNVTFDLGQLLPSLATINSHSEVSMGMNAGGQKQEINMKTDMNIRVEAK